MVYRAEKRDDRSLGFASPKVYAVKKTKKPYAGPADREKKLKEVHILRELRGHDHIVCYEDHWEHNSHLYIQTEFCEEGNLQRFLANAGNKGRLDSFRIWKILSEIASGLGYIHERGYIHLDLKPANVLITFDGMLKIADFGLATSWPVGMDIDGEGDRHYLAPEALRGQYDKPCDIFALGVIMCEIAANLEMPENGDSWQKLRSGDFSELPSLTWSSESTVDRDEHGDPIDPNDGDTSIENLFASATEDDIHKSIMPPKRYNGGLTQPPNFMIDESNPESLHQIVQWMMHPVPSSRPSVEQVYGCQGCQWVQGRSRAGATIFEGNFGPADDVLDHKLDEVADADRMDTD
jgi:mitosis inhibitor protein kinase SWE1